MYAHVDPDTLDVVCVTSTPDPSCSKWRSIEIEDDPDHQPDTLEAFRDEQGQVRVRLSEDKLDAKRRRMWFELHQRRRAKH
jgi:hypothetical protein